MNFDDEIAKFKDLNRYHTIKFLKNIKIEPVVEYPCDKCVVSITCNTIMKWEKDIYERNNLCIIDFYPSKFNRKQVRDLCCPYLEYWQAYNNMLVIKNHWGKDLRRYSYNRVKYHLSRYLYGKANNHVI